MNKKLQRLALGLVIFLCLAVAISAAADDMASRANNNTALAGASPSGETVIYLGTPMTVAGLGAEVSGNTVTIVAGGVYRASGTLTDGMVDVNTADEVELILDNVAITHTTGPAINVTSAAGMSLVLAAGTSNTLIDGAAYSDTSPKAALFSNDSLEISGDGALAVTGKYKHGIGCDDNLIINGGNLTIVSAARDGFHANDNLTVNGGAITVTQASSDGFESEGSFVMAGGALTLAAANTGLISADTLTVNGGAINVTAGVEGIESWNNIIVNAGAITITVSDDGLNAANDITVNGGQLYLTAAADAMDSNGALNINGGTIVALGGSAPEGGLDCNGCDIMFNGGVVVATGGENSTPSSASTQRVVVLGGQTAGTVIHLARDDGAEALTFKVSKAYQSMIFTSPDLAADTTYIVYTGGRAAGGTDFHGLYTGAAYSGGSVWNTFTTNAVVTLCRKRSSAFAVAPYQ